MEEGEDLYLILGLQPGLEGGDSASADAIRKAYRNKALACHPDKRPDDPLAASEFHKLQKAYDVLSDGKARKAYDDLLNVRRAKLEREKQVDAKRRKLMEKLHRQENQESVAGMQHNEKSEEEKAVMRLREEVARIRAMHKQRGFQETFPTPPDPSSANEPNKKEQGLQDKEKMLKASWLSAENGGSDYLVGNLREIFSQFGRVVDIVIRSKSGSKKDSALVVMSTKDEVTAAARSLCGNVSNPLSVMPLVARTDAANKSSRASHGAALDTANAEKNLQNIVGPGYHDYEDSILTKMRKKAEQMKSSSES